MKNTRSRILSFLELEYPFDVRRKEIIKGTGMAEATVNIHLKRLCRCGRVERTGVLKNRKYRFKVNKANGY